MDFKPLSNRVLLKPQELPDTTQGGLIIPEEARSDFRRRKSRICEVVGVGNKVQDIQRGDIVYIARFVGSVIQHNNEPHILVNADDILGKFETDEV